jgi:hypothetical protein
VRLAPYQLNWMTSMRCRISRGAFHGSQHANGYRGARSASRGDAIEACEIVWGARRQGEFGHPDVAVLRKNAAGELPAERHDSTARYFACGRALLGAALVIVAP